MRLWNFIRRRTQAPAKPKPLHSMSLVVDKPLPYDTACLFPAAIWVCEVPSLVDQLSGTPIPTLTQQVIDGLKDYPVITQEMIEIVEWDMECLGALPNLTVNDVEVVKAFLKRFEGERVGLAFS